MKINHNLIRGILKWTGFTIFAISVFIKLKDIIQYGGTKKEVTDDADAPKNAAYDEYPAVVTESSSDEEEYDEESEDSEVEGQYTETMTMPSQKYSRN